MKTRTYASIDGNEAVAKVVYPLNEVIAIYPITPSSPMAEWSDAWMSETKPNIWRTVPLVVQFQSEGGVAGAVHGALQKGTDYHIYSVSGINVDAAEYVQDCGRSRYNISYCGAIARSPSFIIFGDHTDVMAARSTGFAMLCAASVQEAQDFTLISTRATLESRIPFLHFFDGVRTSHEVDKVETLTTEDLQKFIPIELVIAHRSRALTPDRPVLRGKS